MHVDDGVGGGDHVFAQQVQALKKKVLPFCSEKEGSLVFTGIHPRQRADYSIEASQDEYVQQIQPLHVSRLRRSKPESSLDAAEVSQLRGIIGSLQYAVTNTRPDSAARLSEV